MGLRYSPLSYDSKTGIFGFGNSELQDFWFSDFPRKNIYVRKQAKGANNGTSWKNAYTTITRAFDDARALINWSETPWAQCSRIHIAPGSYVENIVRMPHGCDIIGYGDCWDADGETGVSIKPATGAAVSVGGWVNGKIFNINFESADTSKCFSGGEVNNAQIIHCRFGGAPEATTSTGGLYLTKTTALTIRDCKFEYVDCGIDVVYTSSGDYMVRLLVDRNFFTYITEAGVRFGAANLLTKGSAIVNNVMYGGGVTLALGVDDNSGDDNTFVAGNWISATAATEGVSTHTAGNFTGGSTIA